MSKSRKRQQKVPWILLLGTVALAGIFAVWLIKTTAADVRKYEHAVIKESRPGAEAGSTESSRPGLEIVSEESTVSEITILTEDGPFWESQVQENQTQDSQAVELLFGGDVLLSDHVLAAYEKSGGIGGVVGPGYLEEIRNADIFMVNQEFPFSDRGEKAEDKQYTFRLPPAKVSIFQEMGIDIVTLANNHALDFGTDALLDTCKTLDEAGILRVGAGTFEEAKRWQTIEAGGKKIGFLGATRVIPVADWAATAYSAGMLATYDPTILLEQIRAAKAVNDYVVVYVHWGIEREEYPKEYQKTLGHQYIDAGADLVIGSHPHVLQGIEYYNGKPIVYSLGNFVFGSSIPKTMLLKVRLEGDRAVLTVLPGTSSAGYTRELTEEKEKQEFHQYLEGISSVSIDENGAVKIPLDKSTK